MKKEYTKPIISRIELQDRELLSMSTNCKDVDPLTDNCCFAGNREDCPSGLPGGGISGGTRLFDIGS